MGDSRRLIADLVRVGGFLELKGGSLHLEGPEESEPLVQKVTENKAEIVAFLRSLQEKTGRPYVTCYLCSRFRPALNSPNPREALGRCLHRNTTRYALQRTCRHFAFKEGLCPTDNNPQEKFKRLCSLVSESVSRIALIYPEGGYDEARRTGLLIKLQALEHSIDESCKALDEPRLLGALEAWEQAWAEVRDTMAKRRYKSPEPLEAHA